MDRVDEVSMLILCDVQAELWIHGRLIDKHQQNILGKTFSVPKDVVDTSRPESGVYFCID